MRALLIAVALLVATSCGGAGEPPEAGGSGPPVGGLPPSETVRPGSLPREPRIFSGRIEPETPVSPPEEEPCEAWTVPGAYFTTNGFALDPVVAADMDRLAALVRASSGPVQIVGHADARPTDHPGGNDGLSLARAEAVREALAARRSLAGRPVEVIGMGSRRPAVEGANDEAWALNRRVEVTVSCGDDRG